jgi:hypothetical protein
MGEANYLDEKLSNIVAKEISEIKRDAIYLCKAALDFLEMGEETLARYLAEQAMELLNTYIKAKKVVNEDESLEDDSFIAVINATQKVATA